MPDVHRSNASGPDPSASHSGVAAIFTRGEKGFQAELSAYVQDRLRFGAGFVGLCSAALWTAGRVLNLLQGIAPSHEFTHPSTLVHLAATLLFAGAWLLLRSHTLSGRAITTLDALLVWAVIGASVVALRFSYELGTGQIVPMLALALIARAIVVPGRALRTTVLSAPALPLVLLVQLSYGVVYDHGIVVAEDAPFVRIVVWNQLVLATAVVIAAMASYVGFSLRRRAYEAAQIGRYRLERKLGSGAMGEVYLAHHGLLRRPTAVKLLRPEIAGEGAIRRFENEVRQTARLTHPNTIAIYDYGETSNGVFFYAMEYVDGLDLGQFVERFGPLPPARAIHVLAQICGALREAHEAGLVHRDVKPSNVLICRRGGESDVVKVMDFGLVKDTSSDAELSIPGHIVGTPMTMAPETIRGAPATPAVDIYALGAVGCFLVTGRPIFNATTIGEYLSAHLTEQPLLPSARNPDVPRDLENLLLDCLEKNAAARPAGMDEVRRRLLACAVAGRWTDDDATTWWATHMAEPEQAQAQAQRD